MGDKTTYRKDVLVSIVNGNCSGMVQKAVESVFEQTKAYSFDVVVIDNATGYEGLSRLKALGVEVLVNSEPFGFSHNHSQILNRLDNYRYLLLFNDDAFLTNDAITEMVSVLDSDQQIAVGGCYIEDMEGYIQPSAAPNPNIKYFMGSLLGLDRGKDERYSRFFSTYIDFYQSKDVDWVSGCVMLIRSDYIASYGFLDCGYFMYMEDADYCRTVWKQGCRVRYIAEARAVHYGGLSSRSIDNGINPKIFVERQRSRLRYLRRFEPLQWGIFLAFINCFVLVKLVVQVMRGKTGRASALLEALHWKPMW